MAAPLNINPNINPQPGASEEAIAGSSEMIVTGLEKELKLKKTKPVEKEEKLNMEKIDDYVKKLSETTTINPINKNQQKKEEQKEEVLKEKGKKRKKAKRITSPTAFNWIKKKKLPKRKITLEAGRFDKFNKKMTPEALKDYIQAYVKTVLGTPEEEQENANAVLEKYQKLNLDKSYIHQTQTEISNILKGDLSRKIKSTFITKITSKDNFADWIISNKKAGKIVNYALYNELLVGLDQIKTRGFSGKALKKTLSRNWSIKQKKPKELIDLARELGIDVGNWANSFINERILITKQGNVEVNSSLIESEWQKATLLDEFKMLYISLTIEDSFISKVHSWKRIKKVEKELIFLNIGIKERHAAIIEAKKIAWAKIITYLKEAHLARVFSTSLRDFKKASLKISKLTKKAKNIGIGISKEGLKLVEAKLVQLAFETANYKLGILKSMQSLDYDKKRENDIKWLKHATENLKHTEERIEFWERLFLFFSRFLKLTKQSP